MPTAPLFINHYKLTDELNTLLCNVAERAFFSFFKINSDFCDKNLYLYKRRNSFYEF